MKNLIVIALLCAVGSISAAMRPTPEYLQKAEGGPLIGKLAPYAYLIKPF